MEQIKIQGEFGAEYQYNVESHKYRPEFVNFVTNPSWQPFHGHHLGLHILFTMASWDYRLNCFTVDQVRMLITESSGAITSNALFINLLSSTIWPKVYLNISGKTKCVPHMQ